MRVPGPSHLGLGLLILTASTLVAQTHFTATLDGAQHDPPVVTSANGSAEMILDTPSGSLTYSLTLVGVDLDGNQTPKDSSDNVTGLHFHRAPPGMNGPVVFGLIAPGHDPDDLVIDAAAGSLTGSWEETDANGNQALSAELANLLAGNLYLNVHTVGEPTGEIRGQVVLRDLADGLLLHLEFEDDVADSSPNGFDGQASGNLQFMAGVIGQAANFDGADDQVIFPTFPNDAITTNDYSISYWFDAPDGALRSVLGKREFCFSSPFFDIRMGSTRNVSLEINNGSGSFFVGSDGASPGWHHVAFTRTGQEYQAFLDGDLVDEEITDETFDFTNTALLGLSNSPCIGLDGTEMLAGGIDDLRVYDRILTASEVVNLGGIFADGFESGDPSAWSAAIP